MNCKSIIQYSSSSSSQRTLWTHDVFVSFRGEDTRYNFTDHLFAALNRRHVTTFRDDKNLHKGESISIELMQAIQQSRVFIVIFSKNYATSTWCLQELTKIVYCNQLTGQSILPVFFDVDPSEVRKQSGDFGRAFSKHERRYKHSLEMVQRWRQALEHVANLSGWDVQNRPQYGEIEKIADSVISMLGYKSSCPSDSLVGIQSRVAQLENLLFLDSSDEVRVVGICGMGGSGKTTLVRALYDKNFDQYGACCFIDDVSKVYSDSGPLAAQKQLLCQTLNEEHQEIWNLFQATYLIKTRLRHVKSLIVLDNVDETEQLQKLIMSRELLCEGSIIIVVSRDEHILREYGVDEVYNVQLLNQEEGRQLFCRKAFKCHDIMSCDDMIREFQELTSRVLEYARGLPLAIEVLGSFLYGRDISEWRSAVDRLRHNPKEEIMDVLQISFDGLKETEKEIFLDIACFFNHTPEAYVKRVLNCCGFYPDIGIRILINKSLITIHKRNIRMHDILVELGKKIVREKATNEPYKWSRLWLCDDFQHVMYGNMVMNELEAIKLQELSPGITTLRAEALSKMCRLRLLILQRVKFSGNLDFLSNELKYIEWKKYPFTYFPSRCELTKLVALILPYSNIKQLWEGIKPLYNLKIMNLCHSKNLITTPDFRGMPKLEQLNLLGCTKLVKINPSIGHLKKLSDLNLKNCTNLKSLPNSLFGLSSLEVLNLFGCWKLFKDPLSKKARYIEHLMELDTGSTTIKFQSITTSILRRLKNRLPFHLFNSRRHNDTVGSLIPSLPCFLSLRDLDLSFCNLLEIPEAIASLHCLEKLNLAGNSFLSLPCCIRELPRLRSLNLQHCKQLTSLSEIPLPTSLPQPQKLDIQESIVSFCLFDCPKLIVKEEWRSIALSWMIQIFQIHKNSSPSITLVVPGTQIPWWFNYQTVGCSMSIDPFPNVHDNNLIGVAFCAAFVTQELDHQNPIYTNTAPKLTCRIFFNSMGYVHLIPVLLEKNLVTVEWVHLCLLYFPRQDLIRLAPAWNEDKYEPDYFSFLIHADGLKPQGLCLQVKNCGMRVIYRQDLEELNSIITDSYLKIRIDPSHNRI